jgi:hypothetical protein
MATGTTTRDAPVIPAGARTVDDSESSGVTGTRTARDLIKRLLIPLAMLAAALVPGVAQAEESQAWHSRTARMDTTVPTRMFATWSAPMTVPVTTTLYGRARRERVTRVRICAGPSGSYCFGDRVVSHTASGPVRTFVDRFFFDPRNAPSSGWTEVRVTSILAEPDGTQEFTTSRYCVLVQSSKPRSDYCGGPRTTGRCGGGSWYTATGYLVANVDCRDVLKARNGVRPGDVLRVRTEQAGPNVGSVRWDTAAPAQTFPAHTWTAVKVPSLGPGPHELYVRSSARGFTGAYALPVRII